MFEHTEQHQMRQDEDVVAEAVVQVRLNPGVNTPVVNTPVVNTPVVNAPVVNAPVVNTLQTTPYTVHPTPST